MCCSSGLRPPFQVAYNLNRSDWNFKKMKKIAAEGKPNFWRWQYHESYERQKINKKGAKGLQVYSFYSAHWNSWKGLQFNRSYSFEIFVESLSSSQRRLCSFLLKSCNDHSITRSELGQSKAVVKFVNMFHSAKLTDKSWSIWNHKSHAPPPPVLRVIDQVVNPRQTLLPESLGWRKMWLKIWSITLTHYGAWLLLLHRKSFTHLVYSISVPFKTQR